MGSDYFFISELSDITGISYGTLAKKKNIPRSFVAHNVSSKRKGQWIVNKREFFEWYVAAVESGAFAELFGGARPNHDAIHKAMCDYQASLLENVEARRIALADAMYRKRLKGVCTDERSRRKQR